MTWQWQFVNINWKDVQRKNVVNNVDMSILRALWQKGQYTEKHTEQHKKNTKTQKTFRHFFVFHSLSSSLQLSPSASSLLSSCIVIIVDIYVWILPLLVLVRRIEISVTSSLGQKSSERTHDLDICLLILWRWKI